LNKKFLINSANQSFRFVNRLDEPVMIKRTQIVDTIPTNIRATSPKKDFVNLENKLQRLEQLQYALTKQVNELFSPILIGKKHKKNSVFFSLSFRN